MKMKTLTIGRWGMRCVVVDVCGSVCGRDPRRNGSARGQPVTSEASRNHATTLSRRQAAEARSGSTCNLSYNYCASVGEDGTDRNCVSDSNDCMADLVNCSLVTDAWTSSDDCN